MKQQHVIIMRGQSGCGKTTYVNELLKKNPDFFRVSKDYFRYMLNNYENYDPYINQVLKPMEKNCISQLLCSKNNIVVDNTFVRVRSLNELLNLLDKLRYYRGLKFKLEVIDFSDTPMNKCIERDKQKGRKQVGEEVIKKQIQDIKSSTDEFYRQINNFNNKPVGYFMDVHYHSNDKSDGVIVDLDGTLALFSERGPYDYDLVDFDEVNDIVKNLIETDYYKGRNIIILSGRSDEAKEDTQNWIDRKNIPYQDLIMRPQEDIQNDQSLKRKLFDEHIDPYYNIHVAYDDRLSIIDLWNDKGIYTVNFNQGNFRF